MSKLQPTYAMRDRTTRWSLLSCRLALTITTLLVLAACAPRAPEADAVTLVFKHSKLFGDPGPLRALLADFEREHPGVTVSDETLPSSSDEQHQFYAINLEARSSAFDVLAVDVIWVAEFAHAGWLRDLSSLLPAASRGDFFAGPMAAVTYRGAVYAVPWFVDAGLLYYRQDLLEKYGFAAPRTWNELVDTAQAISAQEPGVKGFVWQGKQYEGLVCNVLEYLWSNGGEVLEDGTVVIDTPANREALQLMVDLVHRDRVTPGTVTTLTEEPSRHIFAQERAVFLRNWPYAWALFQAPGSRVRGKVGVAPLPRFEDGASVASLGGWQLAVNAYSKHPVQAEALVRFLTSAAATKRLALAYGFQPARVSLYQDAELLAAQPFLGTLEEIFANARPRPVTPDYVRVSQVLQSAFSAAVAGLKTPEEALAQAQRKLEEVMRDDG